VRLWCAKQASGVGHACVCVRVWCTLIRPWPRVSMDRLVSDLLRIPTPGYPGATTARFITVNEAILRMELMLWCRPPATANVDAQWVSHRLQQLRSRVLKVIRVCTAVFVMNSHGRRDWRVVG